MVNGILAVEEGVNAELKSMEKKLADTLGTKVQIEMAGGRGTISINFFSSEELNAFLNRMMREAGNNVQNETIAGKSIDGIIENKNAEGAPVSPSPGGPVVNEPATEKSDFSGAATVDPVEELLKNFSL